MAAALTIAGVDYAVLQDGAEEAPPRQTGTVDAMFSSRLRSTVRAENRVWRFALAPLDSASYETLRANIAGGTEVQVTGELLEGVTYTCIVDIRGARFIPTEMGLSHERLVSLDVREV